MWRIPFRGLLSATGLQINVAKAYFFDGFIFAMMWYSLVRVNYEHGHQFTYEAQRH